MSSKLKHILVIRLSAMGDVAMTVPVLRVLLNTYPDIRLTILTRDLFKPFFDGLPRTELFIPDLKRRHKGLVGIYRLANDLGARSIDVVADLHDVLRSRILSFFLRRMGIPNYKLDKGREEKKALIVKQARDITPLKSSHQRYTDVFENLGYKVNLTDHQFPEIGNISTKTQELLALLCPSLDQLNQWIGIAPFAKHPGKTYPIDLMEEVIDILAQERRMIFLFGGGEEEVKVMQQIDNRYDNVINLGRKIPLTEELKLMHRLDLMISMDSANMHMASLVGTRVVSIWGATHPYAGFYGFNQDINDAILPDYESFPNLPSSIYGNKVFPGYEECMRSIEPQYIVDRIKDLL